MDNLSAAIFQNIKSKIKAKTLVLNPTLSLKEIEEFEKERNILLPEDYRVFLLEIGNGGAGPPEYGLAPLGQIESDWNKWVRENYIDGHKLKLDFPFENCWIWESEKETAEQTEKINQIYQGSLYLGTDGCASDWMLIISGKERGQVWQFTDVGIQPCAPKRDFLSWYEYWLDGGSDWWKDFK